MDMLERANIKNEVLLKFESDILGSKPKYKFIRDYISPGDENIQIDGLITTEEGYPYCFIDVRFNSQGNESQIMRRKISNDVRRIQARFAVITDGLTYLLLDSSDAIPSFRKKEYDKIIQYLVNPRDNSQKLCEYVAEVFPFLNINLGDVCFDNNKFLMASLDKETLLIKSIFEFEDFSQTVYRYTSLKTVFEMLNDHKIKMWGIAGMNDITEVNYIERILYPPDTPLDTGINKVFIMSCSDNKEDDLTQWRLYGDDGKGVCLKFEPKGKNDFFIFRKIEYLNRNSAQIRKLQNFVYGAYARTGYIFGFNTLHEWCHFIKPKNYEVESEVRLLYKLSDQNPSGWVLSNGTNIVNPYMDFDLDAFPLKLKKIILGPKCPESDMNLFQLKALIENHPNSSLKDIEISKSKIENYR